MSERAPHRKPDWECQPSTVGSSLEHSHQCGALRNSGPLEVDTPTLSISPYHYLGSFRLFQK